MTRTSLSRRLRRLLIVLTVVALMATTFVVGRLTAHEEGGSPRQPIAPHQLDPSRYLTTMQMAFGAPMPAAKPLSPPVTDLRELSRVLDALVVPPSVVWKQPIAENVTPSHPFYGALRVDARFDGQQVDGWAYVKGSNAECAALIVPGSGPDQASELLVGAGYEGPIVPALSERCTTFVLVKPNHDFRAIHYQNHRLNDEWLYMPIIGRGGSYGARYLLEAEAITAYLKTHYPSVGVLGLSEGAWATWNTSISPQSPNWAVLVSGFNTSIFEVEAQPLAGFEVPGLAKHWTQQVVGEKLAASRTHFMFRWGRKEPNAAGLEAINDGPTCPWLRGLGMQSLDCGYHDGYHEYPVSQVMRFVARQLEES